ncbi:hypothetical protein WMF30_53495 [Sorangium sp. So ce134]
MEWIADPGHGRSTAKHLISPRKARENKGKTAQTHVNAVMAPGAHQVIATRPLGEVRARERPLPHRATRGSRALGAEVSAKGSAESLARRSLVIKFRRRKRQLEPAPDETIVYMSDMLRHVRFVCCSSKVLESPDSWARMCVFYPALRSSNLRRMNANCGVNR